MTKAVICALALLAVASCATPPDMSRREAIGIDQALINGVRK